MVANFKDHSSDQLYFCIHNSDYFTNQYFLLCELISKLVIIVTNNFLSLKLITMKYFFFI